MDAINQLKKIWLSVRDQYRTGFVVSERNLQSVLFMEFKTELATHHKNIVVEPIWKTRTESNMTPDLVVVQANEITDILELKFIPQCYVEKLKWQYDIEKLHSYVYPPNSNFPVKLNPNDGKWCDNFHIKQDCRLHFVVVSIHDAAAVCPSDVGAHLSEQYSDQDSNNHSFYHWYGQVGGDDKWDIECLRK